MHDQLQDHCLQLMHNFENSLHKRAEYASKQDCLIGLHEFANIISEDELASLRLINSYFIYSYINIAVMVVMS